MADDNERLQMIREALAQLLEKGGSAFNEEDKGRRASQADETRQKPLERFDLDLGAILGGSQARQAGVNEQTVMDMLKQQAMQGQTQVSRPDADAMRYIGLQR